MNINKKKEMTVLIGIRFNSLGSPSYFMIISFDSIKVNFFLSLTSQLHLIFHLVLGLQVLN